MPGESRGGNDGSETGSIGGCGREIIVECISCASRCAAGHGPEVRSAAAAWVRTRVACPPFSVTREPAPPFLYDGKEHAPPFLVR